MAHSDDTRFEQLLHAYELGMLSGDEEEEFRLLLMKHSSYFRRMQELETATDLMREDPEIRQAVLRSPEGFSLSDAREEMEAIPSKARSSNWLRFWPAPVAAAALLLIMLIVGGRLDRGPGSDAVATGNKLLVTYFVDSLPVDHESSLGEVVTNLLVTDFSQSAGMQVVSTSSLNDLLGYTGFSRHRRPNHEDAIALGRQVGARWSMTGVVQHVDSTLIISARVLDVISGDAVSSVSVTATSSDDIFKAVDELSIAVAGDLQIPESSEQVWNPPVATVTTHSPDAYRLYLQGIDQYNKLYNREAGGSFQAALEYDSRFAMAYYYLAAMGSSDALSAAIQFSDRATERDQVFIRVLAARFNGETESALNELKAGAAKYPNDREFPREIGRVLYLDANRYQEAIPYLREAIRIDPLYPRAYNDLAYALDGAGDFEQAIETIQHYMAVAPFEANPYDSQGDIYSRNGEIDLAIGSYKRTLEIKPDFSHSVEQLGHLYLYKREYQLARGYYGRLLAEGFPYQRSHAYSSFAAVSCAQGQFSAALADLDAGIIRDSLAFTLWSMSGCWEQKLLMKSNIHAEMGDLSAALSSLVRALDLLRVNQSDFIQYRWLYVQRLAEIGRFERAREVSTELREQLEQRDRDLHPYWYARGAIALVEGDYDTAIQHFETALQTADPFNDEFYIRYGLAKAYLESGRAEDAITILSDELTRFDPEWRHHLPIWRAKLHYHLGIAYERANRLTDAAESFEQFLSIWADADDGIAAVEDARVRLARLTS
jgi:tetratricopeptide (TPR) repeat protein